MIGETANSDRVSINEESLNEQSTSGQSLSKQSTTKSTTKLSPKKTAKSLIKAKQPKSKLTIKRQGKAIKRAATTNSIENKSKRVKKVTNEEIESLIVNRTNNRRLDLTTSIQDNQQIISYEIDLRNNLNNQLNNEDYKMKLKQIFDNFLFSLSDLDSFESLTQLSITCRNEL